MFESIVGRKSLCKHWELAIQNNHVGHAYMLVGAKGMGKSTLTQAFIEALTGNADKRQRALDNIHIEPEEGQKTIKINQIRELVSITSKKTYDGNLRFITIAKGETMTIEAQNALLKLLEEPIEGNIFFIFVTSQDQMLQTIRSRCQMINLPPLSDEEIKTIVLDKGWNLGKNSQEILEKAQGNPGRTLELIQKNGKENLISETTSIICDILKGEIYPCFELSEKLGKSKEESMEVLEGVIRNMTRLYTHLQLGEDLKENTPESQIASEVEGETVYAILEILFQMLQTMAGNINLRLQWESTFFKIYQL